MSSADYWLDDYCPPCQAASRSSTGHEKPCDPFRTDKPGLGLVCTCWACLPNDHEIPEPQEPT